MHIMARGVRLLQRSDLRVVKVVIEMRAFAQHGLGAQQDTANSWIRRCESSSVAGEL
jgi:hypothetical protein